MRILLLLFILSLGYGASGCPPGITELRALCYRAPANEKCTEELLNALEHVERPTDPLVTSYKGMAYLLKAKFAINPYCKLAYFSKGRRLLQDAVRNDPKNIEIRFIRLCVQENAPFFLNYNSDIKTDRSVILGSWHNLENSELKNRIRNYMLQSARCSNQEKSIVL